MIFFYNVPQIVQSEEYLTAADTDIIRRTESDTNNIVDKSEIIDVITKPEINDIVDKSEINDVINEPIINPLLPDHESSEVITESSFNNLTNKPDINVIIVEPPPETVSSQNLLTDDKVAENVLHGDHESEKVKVRRKRAVDATILTLYTQSSFISVTFFKEQNGKGTFSCIKENFEENATFKSKCL
jgi:hypothetical protein